MATHRPPRTFSDALRARAKELYDEGHSLNSIAKRIDISPSAVHRWAKAEGLKFDRSQTAMAVRAHAVDLAAARAVLVSKMMVNGQESLDMLDDPWLVYSFGGRDNDYAEHLLDAPPIDARKTAQAIAKEAYVAASKQLESAGTGTAQKLSMLGDLADKMGVKGPLDDE